MPKDLDRRELTQEEIEQEQKEKFKTFFTTSVAQVPEDMIHASERPNRKHGLLARFFAKKEKANYSRDKEEEVLWVETPVAPTGEIQLDGPAPEKADENLELAARPSMEELIQQLEESPAPPPPPARSAEQSKAEIEVLLARKAEEAQARRAAAAKPQETACPAPPKAPETPRSASIKPDESTRPKPLEASRDVPAKPAGSAGTKPSAPPKASETAQGTPAKSTESTLKKPAETVRNTPEKPAGTKPPETSRNTVPARQPAPARSASPEKASETMELTLEEPAAAKPAPPPAPAQGKHAASKKQKARAGRQLDPKQRPQQKGAHSSELEKLRARLDVEKEEAARPAPPEEDKEITQQVGGFHFFGIGEDEAPRGTAEPPSLEDTMSLELHEEEPAPADLSVPAARHGKKGRGKVKAQAKAHPEHAAPVHAALGEEAAAPETTEERPAPVAGAPEAAQPEAAAPAEEAPPTPEEAVQTMDQTVAALTLRTALSGILAFALLWAGLIYEGLLPPLSGLDPAAAPAAFMGANLLLLAGALAVSRNILGDGLAGLLGAPSYDTMPALAGTAALLQAVVALLNPAVYQSTSLTLMSGGAALALFLDNLGTRLLATSVRDGGRLANSGVEHQGAFRAKDKDLIRCLAPSLEEENPWILLSRPVEGDGGILERSFGPRAGEKKVQTLSRVLLACAVVGGIWMLATGKGPNGAAAAMAAVLCLAAPLSSTLIAGLTALRMERTAGAVGAVIPGWAGVEELNGIDTVQVDAGELFTPESAQLEDIRIFKGGRIDRAILYTASVLNQGCNTLARLFRTIIADRTDILPPVKDLERHTGLGFSAWCDNNRILIGTRAYMEQEGVALPEADYEAKHSRNGELQILYLAVSGNMYAMFVLRYVGGKHAARCLTVLQKENIRLLVTCQDPTLTAEKITAAYHLPEGLVTVLDEAQCTALAPAVSAGTEEPCCMLHLKGFTSLTGGLRAAQKAQAAEGVGVAIQLVSAGFSALIGLLLSYSGSIGTLSLLVVVMYQAAWSALGIAAAAMKQHS